MLTKYRNEGLQADQGDNTLNYQSLPDENEEFELEGAPKSSLKSSSKYPEVKNVSFDSRTK